jgi:hypothetical protein
VVADDDARAAEARVGYRKALVDGLTSRLARDLTALDGVRRNIGDKTALARANYSRMLRGY